MYFYSPLEFGLLRTVACLSYIFIGFSGQMTSVWALTHQASKNEKSYAMQKNLLVPDNWMAPLIST